MDFLLAIVIIGVVVIVVHMLTYGRRDRRWARDRQPRS